jgi:RHS repeat-associated protein
MFNTTRLLITDRQRSVIGLLPCHGYRPRYDSFGFLENGAGSRLRFNGQLEEPQSRSYLLGNGYRAYSPWLKRFSSPDIFSPFGTGGLNAYAYCAGDPINASDPSGHVPSLARLAGEAAGDVLDGALFSTLAKSLKLNTTDMRRLIPTQRRLVKRMHQVADSEYMLRHQQNLMVESLRAKDPLAMPWHLNARRIKNELLLVHIEKQAITRSKILTASEIALGINTPSRIPPSVGHDFLSSVLGPAYGAAGQANMPALYGARKAVLSEMKATAQAAGNFARVRSIDDTLAQDLRRIRYTH